MLITETFHSIQGEGPFSGIPMFFVRTNRCNLRCSWCDSKYTFTGGTEVPLDSITESAISAWESWICFTGGEPLIQAEAEDFLKRVTGAGKMVLVETSGSIDIGKLRNIGNLVFDMDIKTPSSGESDSFVTSNLKRLRRPDYLKFVIADETDYVFSRAKLVDIPAGIDVIFQPCYDTDSRWLAEMVIRDHLNVRVMIQLHKAIWGDRPGV
ncbi:MAG: 7-carboxy-7-deazaguanine synthase QueE [Candidatus Thermoplasmatota archaeon]|nr:7-carboxy-7-deazaguanine synthase QueE [Candidatus Thermoplasmatota archaeon]MCL5731133.1 7-carboxy-7-deazaguanine synthase QueE [Candidatus Thermoplasmatota archaeon]